MKGAGFDDPVKPSYWLRVILSRKVHGLSQVGEMAVGVAIMVTMVMVG